MIIRVKKKDEPYVILRKHFINDPGLSLKAKGIMTYLLSKPDGWHVRVGDLVNQNADGEKSIRSGIKELRDAGYMVPTIDRDPENGRVLKYDYDVHEVPVAENGKVVLPLAGLRQGAKRQVENRQVNNKGLKVNNELSNPVKEVDNNNRVLRDRPRREDIIITSPITIKHKRKFNKIKNQIIELGWAGPLDEIILFHNDDPEFVKGWVDRISEINKNKPGNWAGLLRKSLRSGERVPTQEEKDRERRSSYVTGEFAEFIES